MAEQNKKNDNRFVSVAHNESLNAQSEEVQKPGFELRSKQFYWKVPGDVPGKRRVWGEPHVTHEHHKTYAESEIADGITETSGTPSQPVTTTPVANVSSQQPRIEIKPHDKKARKNTGLWQMLIVLLLIGGIAWISYDITPVSEKNNTITTLQLETNKKVSMQSTDNPLIHVSQNIKTKPVQAIAAEPRFIEYVVVKGDTLWDIAEKYHNDPFQYSKLAEMSNIENPDLIYPGDIVRIQIS